MSGFFLLLLTLAAFPLAYRAGRIRIGAGRIAGLLAVMLLPLALFMGLLLAAEPTPEGVFAWWMTGLGMLWPIFAFWCLFSLWGFVVGVRDRRSRA
jgi:hypothetical protein